jgi:eukaryotic-like serine/threonine-protein kinase
MTKIRLNCWEASNCGRELGGIKAYELGVCPASTDVRFDGIHYGVNAGRTCWVIPESMCHGQTQGDFRRKFRTCAQCDFYARVKTEEGEKFQPTVLLLHILSEDHE